MSYLVDTDILIDWLRGKKDSYQVFSGNKRYFLLFIYYITRKELLSACNSTAEKEMILNLLRTMRIVRVDPVIAIKASIDLHLRTSKTLRALINYIEKSNV